MRNYVKFNLLERKGKTCVFHVVSVKDDIIIGRIEWFGSWRQYVFEPVNETIWSQGCLQQIIDFLQELKSEREKKKAKP